MTAVAAEASITSPTEARLDALTPGAAARMESLGRPWQLFVIGVGVTVTLACRLAAANQVFDVASSTATMLNALGMALSGLGLLLVANRRDPFDATGWSLVLTTMVAAGCLSWISPYFSAGTTVWDRSQQAVEALTGLGAGLLLAGVLALALVRRSPTQTTALLTVLGALTLAANTAVRAAEWPSIGLVSLAFALLLRAWDQSPMTEVAFAGAGPPRASRAALALASIVLSGAALQHWIGRGRDVPRGLLAIALAVLVLLFVFASLWVLRREVQRRTHPLTEWAAWKREIQTNEFRGDMAAYGDSQSTDRRRDRIGDVDWGMGELDWGAIELDDDTNRFAEMAAPPATIPALAPDALESEHVRLQTAATTGASSAFSALVGLDAQPANPTPRTVATPAPRAVEPVPLSGRGPDAPVAIPPPRSVEPLAAPTSRSASADRTALVRPQDLGVKDTESLAHWLASLDQGQPRSTYFVAIEGLPITQFDQLPTATQTGAITAIARHLTAITPVPDIVVWLDGPYFMLALDAGFGAAASLADINRQLQPFLSASLRFTDRRLTLDGVLVVLQPESGVTLDQLLDQAVAALGHARSLVVAANG